MAGMKIMRLPNLPRFSYQNIANHFSSSHLNVIQTPKPVIVKCSFDGCSDGKRGKRISTPMVFLLPPAVDQDPTSSDSEFEGSTEAGSPGLYVKQSSFVIIGKIENVTIHGGKAFASVYVEASGSDNSSVESPKAVDIPSVVSPKSPKSESPVISPTFESPVISPTIISPTSESPVISPTSESLVISPTVISPTSESPVISPTSSSGAMSFGALIPMLPLVYMLPIAFLGCTVIGIANHKLVIKLLVTTSMVVSGYLSKDLLETVKVALEILKISVELRKAEPTSPGNRNGP